MADKTSIEWTEATWNPVTGCTKVSPGCDNCYAEKIVERFNGKGAFAIVRRDEEKLHLPLKWRKPRRIFVNSMSDLFHDNVPDGFIMQVWLTMARTPRHTYQVLTKRHARMRSLLSRPSFRDNLLSMVPGAVWPLPNVWLGVSVESQQWADIRIPALLDTPAAVRWLSMEPLLGPVNLDQPRCDDHGRTRLQMADGEERCEACIGDGFHGELSYGHWLDPLNKGISWVVVGGESGPGARPMHPDWVRSLRDQCVSAGVPFFFKQWGAYAPVPVVDAPGWSGGRAFELPGGGQRSATIRPRGRHWGDSQQARPMRPGDRTDGGTIMLDLDTVAVRVGKKTAGRVLDGRTWDEYPAVARG